MLILCGGHTPGGFVVIGPFATLEAADRVGDFVDLCWWVHELCEPLGAATGTAVGVTGNLTVGFKFHGPFADLESATAWAEGVDDGFAVKLWAPGEGIRRSNEILLSPEALARERAEEVA
jgi:hypothetical protein